MAISVDRLDRKPVDIEARYTLGAGVFIERHKNILGIDFGATNRVNEVSKIIPEGMEGYLLGEGPDY